MQGFLQKIDQISPVIYVQIWENRIKVTDIKSGNIFDEKPLLALRRIGNGREVVAGIGEKPESKPNPNIRLVNPFSHPRTLFSDFSLGQILLKHIIDTLLKGKLRLVAPLMVMHPMEKTEGGLTAIEYRAFKDLALEVGARDVAIYQGEELNQYTFSYKTIKANDEDPSYQP
ncbi:MAG: rod shape-determining protein MreB [Cyanothece sp. SIO2G6]|nr:rod shape-determining protein MreB [Cyanothece sp. SIO2G6]